MQAVNKKYTDVIKFFISKNNFCLLLFLTDIIAFIDVIDLMDRLVIEQ